MPINHTFVSGVADTADATKVQPSHWNADHDINIFVDNETPTGTIDGSNDTFTLDDIPVPAASLNLTKNGQTLYNGQGYTLASNIITFEADYIPQIGDILRAWYRKA